VLSYATGTSYDGALGALVSGYAAGGVDVMPVHLADLGGEGLLAADGIHPVDAGHDLVAQVVAGHLAGAR
jgi:hypothetical protein